MVEYPTCRLCGEPVRSPSMGGADICAWCDCSGPEGGLRHTLSEERGRRKALKAEVARLIGILRKVHELAEAGKEKDECVYCVGVWVQTKLALAGWDSLLTVHEAGMTD